MEAWWCCSGRWIGVEDESRTGGKAPFGIATLGARLQLRREDVLEPQASTSNDYGNKIERKLRAGMLGHWHELY